MLSFSNIPSSTLGRFSLFSLQHGSQETLHRQTQKIVWYAESPFRQALIKISEADNERQKWMQTWLHDEIVCILFIIPEPIPTLHVDHISGVCRPSIGNRPSP